MRKKYNAFLSYNKQDRQKVLEIAHCLREKERLRVWLDIWNLIPGDEWQEEIEKALDQSECCVIFLGPNGLGNWQNEEMRSAIYEHVSLKTLRVVPVLLPNTLLPEKESQIPKFLRRLHWINFENKLNEPDALKQLVCGIKGRSAYRHSVSIVENICPFRGLEVFREEDAPFFFGREVEVQKLLDYFKTHRFIAVIGPSGSGKSSVIQAGFIPSLKNKYCLMKEPGLINILKTTLFTPKERPLEELAFALRRLLLNAKIEIYTEVIVERLQKSEKGLHYISREICEAIGAQQIMLIIDQFEEIFVQTKDERQREQFLANIITAVETIGGPVRIILTMRSDFLGKCAAYSDLNTFVVDNLFQIGSLDEKNMARAIVEPARLAGLVFEEGLVSEILRDTKGAPGELPLVEHALLELYERREGNKLTHKAYDDLGRIEGALTKRADLEYEKLTAQQKEIIQKIFVFRLIHPGEGTEDTRRRATMEELLAIGEKPDITAKVIKKWTDARLLTTTVDILKKQEFIDVAHEALIRKWRKLQEWLAQKRETARLIDNIHRATEAWLRANKNPDYLFHGAHLLQIEEIYSYQPDCLTTTEIEFIESGINNRNQETIQRQLELKNRLNSMGALASGLAHEVRNPLAGIKLMAQTLEEEVDKNDPKQEYLQRIIRQVNRLDELLRVLFSYAKPRQPIRKFHRLEDIFQEVDILLDDRIKKRKIKYKKEFQSELPKVYVDFHQIQQVFINLYLNALEAMPNGGQIYLSAREIKTIIQDWRRNKKNNVNKDRESLFVEVTVQDTGIGIKPDHMNFIFDPFFTTKPQGTGLGLSIVYRIIEENEGTIQVESELYKGTTFTILLPTQANSV